MLHLQHATVGAKIFVFSIEFVEVFYMLKNICLILYTRTD